MSGRRAALIVGGGLAGGHIAVSLGNDGFDVTVADRVNRQRYMEALGGRASHQHLDADNGDDLIRLFESRPWDAALWCVRPDDVRDAGAVHRAAAAAEISGIGSFVYLSSLAVYGPTANGVTEDVPRRPTSTYGRRKADEEDALASAGGRCRILVLRLSGLFGATPCGATGSRSSRAITSVIDAHLRGTTAILRVERHRDQYLHAGQLGDVVAALIRAIDTLPAGLQILNVGPGYGLLPDELRAELEHTLEVTVQLELLPDQDDPVGVLDIGKLARLVAVQELMPGLAAGVRSTRLALRRLPR